MQSALLQNSAVALLIEDFFLWDPAVNSKAAGSLMIPIGFYKAVLVTYLASISQSGRVERTLALLSLKLFPTINQRKYPCIFP